MCQCQLNGKFVAVFRRLFTNRLKIVTIQNKWITSDQILKVEVTRLSDKIICTRIYRKISFINMLIKS